MQTMQKWMMEKKAVLLPQWIEAFFSVYTAETVNFFHSKSGQFANPVGYSACEGLEMVYDGLTREVDLQELRSAIDKIIRIRAVQDLPATQAVAFIFQLKRLLRQELLKQGDNLKHELAAIESAIDALALEIFAAYSACREQLYQIKLAEMKKRQMIPQASLNS